jgi:hypothetical protein
MTVAAVERRTKEVKIAFDIINTSKELRLDRGSDKLIKSALFD